MRRSPPKPIRNKLDLTDRVQMRLVRKRLGLSNAQLTAIAGRIGNSLSAISKEVAQQRASALPKPTKPRPGFYWVRVDGDWTIVHVTGDDHYSLMGREGSFALEEQGFGRMVPIRKPLGFPWEPSQKTR